MGLRRRMRGQPRLPRGCGFHRRRYLRASTPVNFLGNLRVTRSSIRREDCYTDPSTRRKKPCAKHRPRQKLRAVRDTEHGVVTNSSRMRTRQSQRQTARLPTPTCHLQADAVGEQPVQAGTAHTHAGTLVHIRSSPSHERGCRLLSFLFLLFFPSRFFPSTGGTGGTGGAEGRSGADRASVGSKNHVEKRSNSSHSRERGQPSMNGLVKSSCSREKTCSFSNTMLQRGRTKKEPGIKAAGARSVLLFVASQQMKNRTGQKNRKRPSGKLDCPACSNCKKSECDKSTSCDSWRPPIWILFRVR